MAVVVMLLVGTENDIPTNPDASLLMPKKVAKLLCRPPSIVVPNRSSRAYDQSPKVFTHSLPQLPQLRSSLIPDLPPDHRVSKDPDHVSCHVFG